MSGPGAPSDIELVHRFRRGDPRAFPALVDRYQHRVYTLCLRWLHEPAVAEETAQDVFVALYRSLDGFRGDAALSTWIFRVAVNHCKNKKMYQRRRAHDRHEPLEGLHPEVAPRQLVSEDPGTDAPRHRSEAKDLLDRAMAELDENHRPILVLRDIEDLDYDEIADILALPRGTVKSRLHRARAELARILARTLNRDDL